KAAFAAGVALDHVEPRDAAGYTQHFAGVDTLRLPRRDHRLAQRIVPKRGNIGSLNAEPRQIDGRIESVAAETTREQAVAGGGELDHAFANGGDLHGPAASRSKSKLHLHRPRAVAGKLE